MRRFIVLYAICTLVGCGSNNRATTTSSSSGSAPAELAKAKRLMRGLRQNRSGPPADVTGQQLHSEVVKSQRLLRKLRQGAVPKPTANDTSAGFYRGSVQRVIHSKEQLGGQVEVYYVGGPTSEVARAKQCVRLYLQNNGAAFCYGFPSRAALDYARVDPQGDGMAKLCWNERASQALAGNRDAQRGNELAAVDHCPR